MQLEEPRGPTLAWSHRVPGGHPPAQPPTSLTSPRHCLLPATSVAYFLPPPAPVFLPDPLPPTEAVIPRRWRSAAPLCPPQPSCLSPRGGGVGGWGPGASGILSTGISSAPGCWFCPWNRSMREGSPCPSMPWEGVLEGSPLVSAPLLPLSPRGAGRQDSDQSPGRGRPSLDGQGRSLMREPMPVPGPAAHPFPFSTLV